MASAATLGMRLDAAIDTLNSLSSTQLYTLIVGVTIVICVALLGSSPDTPEQQPHMPSSELAVKQQHRSNIANGPEPQWHIFRYVNYIVIAVFVGSVADFFYNLSSYWNESDLLIKFLFGWSVLLCYFFGFFGVSFVHDTINTDDEQQQQQAPESETVR
jgi:4-amino-4-deoxy-L-arabinose transferase-like glycosyltransferase